mgnify:CR=1 FL=1
MTLFENFQRELRRQAQAAFSRSRLGQLARACSSTSPQQMARLAQRLKAASGRGARALVQAAIGSELGPLVALVARYSRGGQMGQVIREFLKALGPVGELLEWLAYPATGAKPPSGLPREIATAIRFLESFGYLVAAPDQAAEVAKQYLESLGYEVVERGATRPRPSGLQPEPGRKTVDVELSTGQVRRLRPDHPLVTGEMVRVESSNVYQIGYDLRSRSLYVRYWQSYREEGRVKGREPGPLYRYYNVPPEMFLDFLKATSKGGWVWDHLRVRGTVSGHRFDYALVGISGDYVPRKAMFLPEGEAFVPRRVFTAGQWLESLYPLEVVRPLKPAGPARVPPELMGLE